MTVKLACGCSYEPLCPGYNRGESLLCPKCMKYQRIVEVGTGMKYEIIRRESTEELTAAVTAYINSGWEPIGGVAVNRGHHIWLWAQAIIWRDPQIG